MSDNKHHEEPVLRKMDLDMLPGLRHLHIRASHLVHKERES